MYKIATLNKISPVGLSRFNEAYILTDNIQEADGILVRSQDMHEMEFSGDLKAVARAGAGVNNIPLDRCAQEGIVVFNTPGANANAVKELVLCGLLLAARNVPAALDWAKSLTEDVSKTVEKGKSQFAGHEITGKTLGIVGLGAIGRKVAASAKALGMEIVGFDPYYVSGGEG
ncbi:MAG: 3-phosphoglycerate dehydrogenase, partial [Firmicutes bacterium]|nr:3-phosphoglycerate dehydrogenase [Bacillota bacterium]